MFTNLSLHNDQNIKHVESHLIFHSCRIYNRSVRSTETIENTHVMVLADEELKEQESCKPVTDHKHNRVWRSSTNTDEFLHQFIIEEKTGINTTLHRRTSNMMSQCVCQAHQLPSNEKNNRRRILYQLNAPVQPRFE